MKKFIFLLLLVACEKDEPKHCWECWREVNRPGMHTSNLIEICSLSESEIGTFIADNTFVVNDTRYSMRCQKKQ